MLKVKQQVTINNISIFSEDKNARYVLNTPTGVLKKLNKIISSNISYKEKNLLNEIKGIITGRYPSVESLKNSFSGLKKKVNILSEASLSKFDKFLYSLIVSFSLFSNKITAQTLDDYTRSGISNIVPDQTYGRDLVINIDEEEWQGIERLLDSMEAEIIKTKDAESATENIKDELNSKYNINLLNLKDKNIKGITATDSGRILINVGSYIDLANKYKVYDSIVVKFAIYVRRDLESTIRHELAHREQFRKMKEIAVERNKTGFSDEEESFEHDILLETGAFHFQLENDIKKYKDSVIIEGLVKEYSDILKDIIIIYPSNDIVVKAINEFSKAHNNILDNVKPTINISSTRAESVRKYIDLLSTNGKIIRGVQQ